MVFVGLEFDFVTVIVALAYMSVYVFTLVKQAKAKQWMWFVLTLLFNVVLFVYWIMSWVKKK